MIAETMEAAEAARDAFLAARGMGYHALAPAIQEMVSKALVLGDPGTVGEFVHTRIVGQGLARIDDNAPGLRVTLCFASG